MSADVRSGHVSPVRHVQACRKMGMCRGGQGQQACVEKWEVGMFGMSGMCREVGSRHVRGCDPARHVRDQSSRGELRFREVQISEGQIREVCFMDRRISEAWIREVEFRG
jgi:hypothetical protein